MQKTKTKVRKETMKPNEQEVFRRVLCNIEIMRVLYKESVDLNNSLIDDLCHAAERIEKLEYALIKGMIGGALIVGIVWIISLI